MWTNIKLFQVQHIERANLLELLMVDGCVAVTITTMSIGSRSANDTTSTDGIEVRDILLNGVTLRCFDCCGDVDFNDTHNFFMTPGAIYIVCFNLAEYCLASIEKDSFLLGRLQLWLQYIFTKASIWCQYFQLSDTIHVNCEQTVGYST